eukprot:TRINITY_DN5332_c0_g1_i1.p1 TRINITY_DN5332_c0_g1~~TRINITY_DN5332_c0_g1_i1.p1  ORF type:complete len:902 (+),score=296.66 TRINITY_DN5332_c0_g1_i1:1054-3759(+)
MPNQSPSLRPPRKHFHKTHTHTHTHTHTQNLRAPAMLTDSVVTGLCVGIPLIGMLFAAWARVTVGRISLDPSGQQVPVSKDPKFSVRGESSHIREIHDLQAKIAGGAKAFLFQEYRIITFFSLGFAIIIYALIGVSGGPDAWNRALFSVISFLVGAFSSCLAGWIGMMIAVFTNGRVAYEAGWPASVDEKYTRSFRTAFQGGLVMGFGLTSIGMFNLFLTVVVFQQFLGAGNPVILYECVAAFGLGGSAMAAFGRVGGGIFTKAADVGSDLCGKVVAGLPEDDRRNPGTIADCIGDNVGDIAGMGSDLFGSFGEATCAAMVVAAYAGPEFTGSWSAMMFPILVSGFGMLSCILTSLVVSLGMPGGRVERREDVEPVLKNQLIISTVISTLVLYGLSQTALPGTFQVAKLFVDPATGAYATTAVASWEAFLCIACGLWAGLLIGIMTERFTSNRFKYVRGMSDSCAKGGAATNVIEGLAVGYSSCIVPCFAMAATVYISFNLCLMYGIALAALGVLSTMSIGLTIDAYGPISDNAGGIVEMAEMDESIRCVTDDLDAAGNTTAAIGKGFAISSAAFVALALYGAFVTHAGIPVVNVLDARTFPGMLVGAMLPYWFSGMTMTSVNKAAMAMVMEIKSQFEDPVTGPKLLSGEREADHNKCVAVATNASLEEMIAPAGLVMLSPLVCGVLFGKEALSGLLPGATVSGVEMAISMSNTGGAWDNAKKYIEGGQMVVDARGRPLDDVIAEARRMRAPGADRSGADDLKVHTVRKKKNWTGLGAGEVSQEGMSSSAPDWKRELVAKVDAAGLQWARYSREQALAGTDARPSIADVDHTIHSSAVIGDTVGDPLKDTSGPALNILVKLMAILSVVFVPVVNGPYGGLVFDQWLKNFTKCASVDGVSCA